MTTGRINQVTIVNAIKGPLWRLPLVAQRKRFLVTFVMALSRGGPEDQPVRRRQEQPPRRGRRSHSWLPLSPSRFPRALSADTVITRVRKCRLGAPRGDRVPRLQLFSVHQGGGISCCSVSGLAIGQSSTEPILWRRAAEAADTFGHTTDGPHLGGLARGGVWFKL